MDAPSDLTKAANALESVLAEAAVLVGEPVACFVRVRSHAIPREASHVRLPDLDPGPEHSAHQRLALSSVERRAQALAPDVVSALRAEVARIHAARTFSDPFMLGVVVYAGGQERSGGWASRSARLNAPADLPLHPLATGAFDRAIAVLHRGPIADNATCWILETPDRRSISAQAPTAEDALAHIWALDEPDLLSDPSCYRLWKEEKNLDALTANLRG